MDTPLDVNDVLASVLAGKKGDPLVDRLRAKIADELAEHEAEKQQQEEKRAKYSQFAREQRDFITESDYRRRNSGFTSNQLSEEALSEIDVTQYTQADLERLFGKKSDTRYATKIAANPILYRTLKQVWLDSGRKVGQ